MQALDIYLKVQADLNDGEDPRRFAEELCRMLQKLYAVRRAEISNIRNLKDDQ
jgi:hypothetical protein